MYVGRFFGFQTAIIEVHMGARAISIDDDQFASIRKALADPKRFEILENIAKAKETPTCTCVRGWTGLAPATVSHHLKELETAGLITMEREGKFAHISIRRDVWQAYLRRLSEL